MKQKIIFTFFLSLFAAIIVLQNSCTKEQGKTKCDSLNTKFTAVIMPIIQANCATPNCHVSGFSFGDFTTYDGVKAKVDNGSFNNRVIIQKNMPPSVPLPDSLLQKIDCWVQKGARSN